MSFNPRLSGLRGLASLAVVLFHASLIVGFMPSVNGWFASLWMGVPVFLMLSMFLLLKRLDGNPDLKNYFARRIKRIWPIYYVTVTSFFVLYQASVFGRFPTGALFSMPVSDFVRDLTFTEYWLKPFTSTQGPAIVFWTLQLEEAMYLLIPVIHRSRHKKEIAGGFIAASGVWLLFAWVATNPPAINPTAALYSPSFIAWDNLWIAAPTWLASYGFGILAYLGYGWQRARWTVPLLLVLASGVEILFANSTYAFTLVGHSVIYLMILPGVMSLLKFPPAFFGKLVIVGEESYALYAVHYAFILLFGLFGVIIALIVAFGMEFALRPREILKRLGSRDASVSR